MTRGHWQRIAGLIAAGLLAVLLHASPAAAQGVSNVAPVNGSQEPIVGDVVPDNEELWAYVTSAFGGVICVHPATENPGGCKGEDTWGETPIPPFTANFVPIQAGRLRSGDWVLVGATAGGEPATAVSGPFTVEPCRECPPADFSKNHDFRIAAESLLTSITTTCSLMQAASMLWRAKGVYTFAQTAIAGVGGGLAVSSVMVTVAGGAEAVYDVAKGDDLTAKLPGGLGTIADGICKAADKIEKFKESSLGHWVGAWAADPPDPAFTLVAEPPFTDYGAITGMPDWGFNTQRASLDHIRAYAQSSLHAYERYQGADQAGAGVYEHAQARAMGDDLLGFAHTLRDGADFVAKTAGQMRSEFPDAADRTVTQADIDAAHAYVARLKATGYTTGEVGQLHALGLNDDAIARLKVDQTIYDPADAAPGVLDEAFDDLAARMREAAVQAEDFAAEAWTFAGRSDTPPAVQFSEGPRSGPGGLTLSFTDTTANPDLDPFTLAWDFGDGATAAGAPGGTVTHAYAGEGPYTVTLTATDDYGSAGTSRVVSPGTPNQPPTAAFSVTPSSGDAPLGVHVDASASADADGTIAAYEWAFGDGNTGSGKLADHTFTAPGTYGVDLTVTDNRGSKATIRHDVTVTQAPRAPVAADDDVEASPTAVLDVLANDEDADQELLTLASSTAAAHGSASCTASGTCTYTASAGYLGPDSFTYTVRDPGGRQDTGTVNVTVKAPEATGRPVARADEVATRRATAATFNVLANDTGTGIGLIAHTDPEHGTAACGAAGACTYTPESGFSGADGFRYTIADGDGNESGAEVHITVAPADAAYGAAPAASTSGPVVSGDPVDWGVGVAGVPAGAGDDALAAVPRPSASATLGGAHTLEAGSVKTARGWTAGTGPGGAVTATAGPDALLGEADTQLIAKPLPPVSQGTGGDGYVPILVGQKVFAFFHHTHPTKVTCIDRTTGSLCPGYPMQTNFSTNDFPGHGAVVGSRIYVHIDAAGFYPTTAPMGLYCWDTATARPCGYVIVRRFVSPNNPGGSSPELIDGKLYFAGDGGRLYCVDPSTNTPCTSIATGLTPELGGTYDIVSHGTRAYVLRRGDALACVDVKSGGACNGWPATVPVGPYADNLVNRHSPAGVANGVCVVGSGDGRCYLDAGPAPVTEITWLPSSYWGTDTEAETGTRTLVASGASGLSCWDWTTLAPCSGNGYDAGGAITLDTLGEAIPGAYGAVFDGSCVVGLGDPGLVFTVDPAGFSPCSSLPESRTLDLRDQRCDGTVGSAAWQLASLQAAKAGELTAVQLTVRDAATGATLLSKDLVTGDLDLRGIDAKAHPAITITALARSAPGDAAWADAVPPRIRIAWKGDPRQLCFRTRTKASCPASPVSVTAVTGSASRTTSVALSPTGCATPTPTPSPTPTPTPEPTPDKPPDSTDLVLGCSDRRVVLEDVFVDRGKVRLLGVAARELAGQRVQLVFAATRKTVATATLGPDGRFAASAPLPPKKLRGSDKARYVAKVGGESSLTLKLVRRMLVTKVTAAAGKVTIAGRVVPPLAAGRKDRAVTVQRVVACKSVETVATVQPKGSGAFSVTVRAPEGQSAAVYRLMTKVRVSARSKSLARTFTLPRAVDFR